MITYSNVTEHFDSLQNAIYHKYIVIPMLADSISDNESMNEPELDVGASFNETAMTKNPDLHELDCILETEISPKLQRFYKEKLLVKSRHFKLQTTLTVSERIIAFIVPCPQLYIHPYTILVDANTDLQQLCKRIYENIPLNECFYDFNRQEISVKVHTPDELTFYKIRKVVHSIDHRFPECLDEHAMVDKLFQFYAFSCQKLQFGEVCGCFMYWAYMKGLQREHLNGSCMKILLISLYITFGIGIGSIMPEYKVRNKSVLEEMRQMSKNNKKGESHLSPELKYENNFTIKPKKGLFIKSQHRYSKILEVYPIAYPVDPQEYPQYAKTILNLKQICKRPNEISIAKCLFRIFKLLNSLLNQSLTIRVDLNSNNQLQMLPSEDLGLQIIHPVLGHNIYSGCSVSLRKMQNAVEEVSENIRKCSDPLQVFKAMFSL